MKKFLLVALLVIDSLCGPATELVLYRTGNFEQTRNLFENPNLTVHFFSAQLVIATAKHNAESKAILLDARPWRDSISYYLVYINSEAETDNYLKTIGGQAEVLYRGEWFLVVSTNEVKHGQLIPARNDGMVRIKNVSASLPQHSFPLVTRTTDPNPFVVARLNEVSASNITSAVQHLQSYGTRDAYHSQSVAAQQWIASQFQLMGLNVEVMDFTMPGGPASDNVIATLPGSKYPNEFIVVGGHYDSRNSSGPAPGADDNASGTAAVLEIARILSSHQLDRSVVFCAFSGEEYGLYGSSAYATRCRQQGVNILGYFNLDMIGYLQFGNSIITTLIYPQSAQPLANFYTQVCYTYLPSFTVQPGALAGGDSDHTSFNQNGYMGIFPFENINAYSPYIHTTNDVVGVSYNNENQAAIFTMASLASVITLANMKMPPQGLTAIPGDGRVTLSWNPVFDIDCYRVYRNGALVASTALNSFADSGVVNFTQYTYHVTAIFSDNGQESEPSNQVKVTPVPPISLPLFLNFENGTPYWKLEPNWGVTTAAAYSQSSSLTESPNGQYANNENSSATLSPFSLKGYTSATLSFWTKYEIENNYDYMFLEISANGNNWEQLAVFTGTQSSWISRSYSLNSYLNQGAVFVRFRFTSDYSVTKDGMCIDDFQIAVTGPGFKTQIIRITPGWSGISSYIMPESPAMVQLLEPVANAVCVVQDLTSTYAPSFGLNTLTGWNVNSGYVVKSNEDASLAITGLAREDGALNLTEGWNLIPVFSRGPVPVEMLFQNILNSLEIVKEVAGPSLYWPALGISTLSQIEPGKSYMVKVNSGSQIVFPIATVKKEPMVQSRVDCPWPLTEPKPHTHVVGLPSSALQFLAPGDILGAFTPAGLCAGAIQVDNPSANYALVLYPNDFTTPGTDGFLPNEPITIKAYSPSNQIEKLIAATFSNLMPDAGLFTVEGISMVKSLTFEGSSVPVNSFGFSVYPNPAGNYIRFGRFSKTSLSVKIISSLGREVFAGIVNDNSIISTENWSNGVYIVKATDELRCSAEILIVNR